MSYFAFRKTVQTFSDLIDYIFADEEKRNFIINVPHYCRKCEMLKITGSAITGVHLLAKINGIDKPAKYVEIIKTATG